MLHVLGWLIAGLIIGAIARLIVPGRQAIGFLGTMLLGIVGAFLGGGVAYLIWGNPGEPFSQYAWPGYLLSILGAAILLWIASMMSTRRTWN
jgi:uncharacterized membrane protein YeaQ/YmgE (transglycosylase-associated protein family)